MDIFSAQPSSGHVKVGRFNLKIDRKISEGGYGFVYEAVDAYTQQRVALKQINVHDADSRRLIEHEVKIWVSPQRTLHLKETS
jgi:serine/threonine protein kinase